MLATVPALVESWILTFCLQVKSQLERLLGRCWVKLSTCRSAPLTREWPHAPEPLCTFWAQRQEPRQISSHGPKHGNICFGGKKCLVVISPIHLFYLINVPFVFQCKTHQVISIMTSHLGPLTSAEFCPWDEDVFVTISEDRTFKVCCEQTLLVLPYPADSRDKLFTPDRCGIWNPRQFATTPLYSQVRRCILCTAFHPKGRLSNQNVLTLMTTSNSFLAFPLLSLLFLKDNRHFITGSTDGQVRLFTY